MKNKASNYPIPRLLTQSINSLLYFKIWHSPLSKQPYESINRLHMIGSSREMIEGDSSTSFTAKSNESSVLPPYVYCQLIGLKHNMIIWHVDIESTIKQGFHNRSAIFKQTLAWPALQIIPQQLCDDRIIPTFGHLRITETYIYLHVYIAIFNKSVSIWPPYEQKTPRTIPSIEAQSLVNLCNWHKHHNEIEYILPKATPSLSSIKLHELFFNTQIITEIAMADHAHDAWKNAKEIIMTLPFWQGPLSKQFIQLMKIPHWNVKSSLGWAIIMSYELWQGILHFTSIISTEELHDGCDENWSWFNHLTW